MGITHNNNYINHDNNPNDDFTTFSQEIENKISNLTSLSTEENIKKIYNIKNLLKVSNTYKLQDINQFTKNDFTEQLLNNIKSDLYSQTSKANIRERIDKINKIKGSFQDIILTKNFNILYRLIFIAFDINKETMFKISRSTNFKASVEQLHNKLLKLFNGDSKLFYAFLDSFFVIKFGKSNINFDTFFSKKLNSNIKEEDFGSISLKQSEHKEIVKKFNELIDTYFDSFIDIQEKRFGIKQQGKKFIFAGFIIELFKEILEVCLSTIRTIYDFKNTSQNNIKGNNNFQFLREIEKDSKTKRFFNSLLKAIIKYNKEISELFVEYYTITNVRSLFSLNEQYQNMLLFSLGNIAITDENSLLTEFKYETDKHLNFKVEVDKNLTETNKVKSEEITNAAIIGYNNGIGRNTNVFNSNMVYEQYFLKSNTLVSLKRQRGESYFIKYLYNNITLDVVQSIGEFVIVDNDLLQKSL